MISQCLVIAKIKISIEFDKKRYIVVDFFIFFIFSFIKSTIEIVFQPLQGPKQNPGSTLYDALTSIFPSLIHP
jgi:hypothetical protein